MNSRMRYRVDEKIQDSFAFRALVVDPSFR